MGTCRPCSGGPTPHRDPLVDGFKETRAEGTVHLDRSTDRLVHECGLSGSGLRWSSLEVIVRRRLMVARFRVVLLPNPERGMTSFPTSTWVRIAGAGGPAAHERAHQNHERPERPPRQSGRSKGSRRDPVLALPRLGGSPPRDPRTGPRPDTTLLAPSASWRLSTFRDRRENQLGFWGDAAPSARGDGNPTWRWAVGARPRCRVVRD
jgi:hypothetical protein